MVTAWCIACLLPLPDAAKSANTFAYRRITVPMMRLRTARHAKTATGPNRSIHINSIDIESSIMEQ
jgi:hypothetical protein